MKPGSRRAPRLRSGQAVYAAAAYTAIAIAMTWPLHGIQFAQVYISSVAEHSGRLLNVPMVLAGMMGLGLLAWDWWRRSRLRTGALAQRSSRAPTEADYLR